ncbi:MAG: hypothetical protein HFH14_00255 [Lachnospiraceae bacterium]|nr:hypothetical protein [Lachnospiraceae bacterium]
MDDNKTYIVILRDSLVNKNRVLDDIIELTERQYELVKSDNVEAEDFDYLIEEKGKNLAMLSMIDDGFDGVYTRVRDELQANPGKYGEMISEIRNLIEQTIAKGAKIETLEHRNKEHIEAFIEKKKNEVKEYKARQNTAKHYTMNMGNRHKDGSSYFMDKKN